MLMGISGRNPSKGASQETFCNLACLFIYLFIFILDDIAVLFL
jgi:hypothetical protein